MPNPLILEVTIQITVYREWFEGLDDNQICNAMDEAEMIMTSDWDSVSVRVAEPLEKEDRG